MKKINIRENGYGHWGKNFISTFGEIKDVVSRLVEINERNIKNIQEKYPSLRVYKSFIVLQELTEIDAVIVVFPATSNLNLFLRK